MTRRFGPPPDGDEIAAIADEAIAMIPENLKSRIEGIAILVTEFPEADILDSLGVESDFGLLGLYQGISLDQASGGDVMEDLNRIYLYRRPLLDAWAEGDDSLEDLVHNTIIHEIGHHFGLSDDDMERLESR